MRVVADTANGMGGLVVPRVFATLPFELDVLYGELDGTFPNHPADPIQPENLRDLQFEYRLGKLSDEDYQNTKKDLQKELAAVLAEVDRLKAQMGQAPKAVPAAAPVSKAELNGIVCPSCGSRFEKSLKFCGECGKPMKAAKA